MSLKQEEAWIDRWGELYDLIGQKPNLLFCDANWQEITKDEAFGFIQDEAYEGYFVEYEEVWFKGKEAIRYFRGKSI